MARKPRIQLGLPWGVHLQWHVGDVIRKLREQKRWNQQRLADASDLNKSTVVSVEANANVKRETLEAIARGLGTSVGQIYALVPQETQRSAAAAETIPAHAVGAAGTPFHGSDRRQINVGPPPGVPERRR